MAWSDLFIPSKSQTAAEQEANYRRQQAEFNRRLEARRESLTPEEVAFYTSNVGELEVQDLAAVEGFGEGLQEGWDNVLDAPGKAVGAIGDSAGTLLGGILKNVPWWAYIAAAAALFFWMGGAALLRGRLAKL
jgi:hypothetical protein